MNTGARISVFAITMHSKQRQRIIARHKSSLFQHGPGPRALFWQDETVQTLRFDSLLTCGVESGDRILDVGCGLADLHRYMQSKELDVDYTGIDLSPDLIEAAQLRDPTLKLFVGDIFDFAPADQAYDWVLLSGALNEPLQDDGDYLRRCLPRLYASARKGLAFNLLNADYPWPEKDLFHLQPYSPADVVQQLEKLSPFVDCRKDYMENDVSFFVWRDEASRPSDIFSL